MSAIKRKYWAFYLEGREERRMAPLKTEADIATVVLELEECSLHDVIRDACAKAADEHLTLRVKRRWMSRNTAKVEKLGCDPEEAYQAWCQGRIDELASAIESNVIGALEEECLDDDPVDDD